MATTHATTHNNPNGWHVFSHPDWQGPCVTWRGDHLDLRIKPSVPVAFDSANVTQAIRENLATRLHGSGVLLRYASIRRQKADLEARKLKLSKRLPVLAAERAYTEAIAPAGMAETMVRLDDETAKINAELAGIGRQLATIDPLLQKAREAAKKEADKQAGEVLREVRGGIGRLRDEALAKLAKVANGVLDELAQLLIASLEAENIKAQAIIAVMNDPDNVLSLSADPTPPPKNESHDASNEDEPQSEDADQDHAEAERPAAVG